MRLSDLRGPLEGRILGQDAEFDGVATDSRKPMPGRLFVALQGPNFDGHEFLEQARFQGAKAALVSRSVATDLPQLQVPDTRLGLGRLGQWWRLNHFQGSLIAVTGSNGKTTVKEMIFQVMGGDACGLKTQGNLNNDIGVPLTLLGLKPEHHFAVVEMGANHAGEIAYSTGLACPDVGVITNAGPAHLEGFGSLLGVAQAKGELVATMPSPGTAILNADDRFFNFWKAQSSLHRLLTFGLGKKAQVRGEMIGPLIFSGGRFRNSFVVNLEGERFEIELALAGHHNVVNALAAIAVGVAAGIEVDLIQSRLAQVLPVSGRLCPLPGRSGSWLLDDCYNANPASFEAGLEALLALGGEPWVILGAFGELGQDTDWWHARVGTLAKEQGVTRLFAVGQASRAAVKAFGSGAHHFENQEVLLDAVAADLNSEARVLIKGSRSQQLEKIVQALQGP